MKLRIQHRHHQPSESFLALVHEEFAALAARLRIDEARVLIECRRNASPPFRMSAHLVTPGPDVVCEAADHTLRAALGKLVRAIHDTISERSRRRSRRLRSRESVRSVRHPALA